MGKKGRGRPRKKPPVKTEFGQWLRGFMAMYRLKPKNIAATTGVSLKTVYGWQAGRQPLAAKAIRTALEATYGRGRTNEESAGS